MNQTSSTVFVTGASSGIGLATTAVFARAGYRVFAAARRLEALKSSLLEELGQTVFKNQIVPIQIDVTSEKSVKECFDLISSDLKSKNLTLDILVNNAGLALGVDRVENGKNSDWTAMLDTNILGLLQVTRTAIPLIRESTRGQIINLGSIAGHIAYEGGSVYCATKFAVDAITKTLRLELNGTGIRVGSIDPGMVETNFSNVRLGDEEKAKAVYRGLKPLTALDIAESIAWMASRPLHVNIDQMVIMPTAQATPYKVHRSN